MSTSIFWFTDLFYTEANLATEAPKLHLFQVQSPPSPPGQRKLNLQSLKFSISGKSSSWPSWSWVPIPGQISPNREQGPGVSNHCSYRNQGNRALWRAIPKRLSELPKWHGGKESACQYRRHKRNRFVIWVGKIPWRRKWQSTPVFLHGKSHGQRSLAGYSPWSHKLLDMTKHTTKYWAENPTNTD